MQLCEFAVAQAYLALPQAQLRQARAHPHPHRKGARGDLGIERAGIAGLDCVEFAGAVGDHAG